MGIFRSCIGSSLAKQVSSVIEWHINADESRLLDYNEEFNPATYAASIYTDSPWRSSDHDPVIITFDFDKNTVKLDELIASFYQFRAQKLLQGTGKWYWKKFVFLLGC